MMEDVRYPIGKFNPVENANNEHFINQLEKQSDLAKKAVEGLSVFTRQNELVKGSTLPKHKLIMR